MTDDLLKGWRVVDRYGNEHEKNLDERTARRIAEINNNFSHIYKRAPYRALPPKETR